MNSKASASLSLTWLCLCWALITGSLGGIAFLAWLISTGSPIQFFAVLPAAIALLYLTVLALYAIVLPFRSTNAPSFPLSSKYAKGLIILLICSQILTPLVIGIFSEQRSSPFSLLWVPFCAASTVFALTLKGPLIAPFPFLLTLLNQGHDTGGSRKLSWFLILAFLTWFPFAFAAMSNTGWLCVTLGVPPVLCGFGLWGCFF